MNINFETVTALICAVALLVYLAYAMLKPEKF